MVGFGGRYQEVKFCGAKERQILAIYKNFSGTQVETAGSYARCVLVFYNMFSCFPLAAYIENTADDKRHITGNSISVPEPSYSHIKSYAHYKREADPCDKAVKNCRYKI